MMVIMLTPWLKSLYITLQSMALTIHQARESEKLSPKKWALEAWILISENGSDKSNFNHAVLELLSELRLYTPSEFIVQQREHFRGIYSNVLTVAKDDLLSQMK
jgi:hypothetical protein